MKVSTRSRYGVNAMFELALGYGKGALALKDIAERQQLSEAYLEQLFIRLKKAGLVEGVRGASGGYVLSKPPENISMGDIIRALEGGIAPVDCLEGSACSRGLTESCPGRFIWEKVYAGINSVIDSITLKDMQDEFTAKGTVYTDG